MCVIPQELIAEVKHTSSDTIAVALGVVQTIGEALQMRSLSLALKLKQGIE